MRFCKSSSTRTAHGLHVSLRSGWASLLLQVIEETDLGVEALRTLRHLPVAKPLRGAAAQPRAGGPGGRGGRGAGAVLSLGSGQGSSITRETRRVTSRPVPTEARQDRARCVHAAGSLIVLQGLDEARGVGKEEIPTEHLKSAEAGDRQVSKGAALRRGKGRNVRAEDPVHRLLLPPGGHRETEWPRLLSFRPRVGVIEDVVVDEGSSVDDLDRRRQHQDLVVGTSRSRSEKRKSAFRLPGLALRRSCSHRISGHRPAVPLLGSSGSRAEALAPAGTVLR